MPDHAPSAAYPHERELNKAARLCSRTIAGVDLEDSRSSEESKPTPAVPRSRGEKRDAAVTPDASQCESEGATGSASQRPRLLDLFCGAGGAAMGYWRAGFDVVGVDIAPQPRYPFEFVQMDALTFLQDGCHTWHEFGAPFSAIHASPPCQHYSDLAHRNGNADEHPDLIDGVLGLLQDTGLPYIIENVEGAPLRDPVTICGTALGLGVDGYRLRRHRLFETDFPLTVPPCACACDPRPIIDVSGGGPTHAPRLDGKGGRTYKGTVAQKRAAMGIGWMTGAELVEAIPPAYTEMVGLSLWLHWHTNRQEAVA